MFQQQYYKKNSFAHFEWENHSQFITLYQITQILKYSTTSLVVCFLQNFSILLQKKIKQKTKLQKVFSQRSH